MFIKALLSYTSLLAIIRRIILRSTRPRYYNKMARIIQWNLFQIILSSLDAQVFIKFTSNGLYRITSSKEIAWKVCYQVKTHIYYRVKTQRFVLGSTRPHFTLDCSKSRLLCKYYISHNLWSTSPSSKTANTWSLVITSAKVQILSS